MKLILAALLILVLTGCGGEESRDLQDFVKSAGVDMRGKIPPAEQVKPYQPFIYENSTGLTDPFKPRKPETRGGGRAGINQPDIDRPKEALEDFPLESLKMLGFLQRKKTKLNEQENYGLVRAPDNQIYKVKVKNHMGLNFGEIVKITEQVIEIKEVVQDSSGEWTPRTSTLQLVE